MLNNKILQAVRENRPAFGVYAFSGSPKMIELLGFAGLDYVRIDMEASSPNPETVQTLIHTAHAAGITPFIRIPEPLGDEVDTNLIERVIDMGAMGIIVPKIASVAQVKNAVKATKGAPLGDRNIGNMTFAAGYGRDSSKAHAQWANENILLSIQVETVEGIENIEDLAAVDGVDIVQSGRGDLAHAYGVPGQQYSETVIAAEKRLVSAALGAGKLASVHYFPLKNQEHIGRLKDYMSQGVQVINLGVDQDIVEVYRRLLSEMKEGL